MVDHQPLVDWVDDRITERPGAVVLLFLVVTAVFTTGLGAIESESGQSQFIEDLPSYEALEDIQRDFGTRFGGTPTDSTTLLQQEQNALAKPALLRSLRAQERVADVDELHVTSTSSPAASVAQTLDPNATTLAAQIDTVERATPSAVERAVRTTAETDPTFTASVSEDFNRQSATASVTEATISHGTGDIANREERVRNAVASVGGDIRVLGSAPDTIFTSLAIVLPAAFVFIVLFLVVAYRDLVDLVLGVVAILMALVWTFGFIGLAGIPFSPLLVSVPPLLIAVGIDFGIHAVNRYREERQRGDDVGAAMRVTTDQLLVAFFIVTGTTVIGFLSNLVSAFPPNRDFGLVAAIGIAFTFLVFGVFLPAAKVYVDRLRERYPIPEMSQTPLGAEQSRLGRLLTGGVVVAERAPVLFLVVVLVGTAVAGGYATDVGTEFDSDDFLPAEETPEALQYLPEPIRPPAEFQYIENKNLRERHFDLDGRLLFYVEGDMRRDSALEALHRATRDPPDTVRRAGRYAERESVVTLVRQRAAEDPAFRRLVARHDRDGNGIPDDDLPEIYAALESAPDSQLDRFLSDDRRGAQVVYTVDESAANAEVTADARAAAADFRADASPTGFAVIFEEAGSLILRTVVQSLVITLVGSALFLVFIYWVLEGRPSLGVANTVPIAVAVALVVASMRCADVNFNAVNGSILAITVGLGIDYSVHVVHRFADERRERDLDAALRRTVVGTGGALTGSMLTTVSGVGVLVLALNPVIGVFGLLTALSVVYAYLASIFVLPSVLVVWDRLTDRETGSFTPELSETDLGWRPVSEEAED